MADQLSVEVEELEGVRRVSVTFTSVEQPRTNVEEPY
jgi:hypothetical protein